MRLRFVFALLLTPGTARAATCGNGDVGDGICAQTFPDVVLCCSTWGWCGATDVHCGNTAATGPSPTTPAPQPTTTGRVRKTRSPSTSRVPLPAPSNPPSTMQPSLRGVLSSPPSPTGTSAPAPVLTSCNQAASGSVEQIGCQLVAALELVKTEMDDEVLVYQKPDFSWAPSTIYRYAGLINGIKAMYSTSIAGNSFYVGPTDGSADAHKYGLVNVAAFLAQAMKETIQYDACDENSWDLFNGGYPLSNACGQLGQSYQDYKCPAGQELYECPVDPDMEITAATNAKWYGAPGPLKCGPKTTYPFTGKWDPNAECNQPWADPPKLCTDYEGQKAGGEDNSSPVGNRNGRTDVEGCCWWGRGVIQTSGICNYGKLNYFLGKRAADEGRPSRYPSIDFCKNPEAICASQEYQELKWIAGLFYWIESVQTYSEGGWDFMKELHAFVDGGMVDSSFIDAVSGIVNRGCHNPPCGTGPLDGGEKRRENFAKALTALGL